MTYVRKQINGTSPMDLKNLNDNMTTIWLKVFGDINMSDIQDDIKTMLYTNWLQINGEGNLDSTHPLEVRFYIPPTTKKIKSSNLNLLVSRYRMDSSVAISTPANSYGSATTSQGAGAFNVSQTSEVKDWKASGTTGWGTPTTKIPGDFSTIVANGTMLWVNAHKVDSANPDVGYFVDLFDMNHRHDFTVSASNHTHDVEVSISIPEHYHNLNEGIKESSVVPSNIKCFVNDNDLQINLGDNGTINDKDITSHLLIGQWNIIKITTTTLARVTVYGIAELLQNYK